MMRTKGVSIFSILYIFVTAYTTPAKSAPTPSEILSPVVGDLEVVSSFEQCSGTKWCFDQHKTVFKIGIGHMPEGGLCKANDTYAWDINLDTPRQLDLDKGKPVYAVEKGIVSQSYGGCPNAGGSSGQLLVEHNFQGGMWWSGYLHLRDIQVSAGNPVDKDTLLGYISNTSPLSLPNHLHFVAYEGRNTQGGLISFDARIVPRISPSSQTLAIDLTATGLQNLSSIAPAEVTFTATVLSASTATGTVNYTFWWNCSDTSSSVAVVMAGPCGSIPTPTSGDSVENEKGIKFNGIAATSKTVTHKYEKPGTYTVKVIVERGNALPAEKRISFSIAPPTTSVLIPPDAVPAVDIREIPGDCPNCGGGLPGELGGTTITQGGTPFQPLSAAIVPFSRDRLGTLMCAYYLFRLTQDISQGIIWSMAFTKFTPEVCNFSKH